MRVWLLVAFTVVAFGCRSKDRQPGPTGQDVGGSVAQDAAEGLDGTVTMDAAQALDGAVPLDAAEPTDGGAGGRRQVVEVPLDANGISQLVSFDVPAGTRSVSLIARGQSERLYGLASLKTADGVEHVGLDLGRSHRNAMQASYRKEQVGYMPGSLIQVARLGTFSFVYPNAPGQSLPPGSLQIAIASDASDGSVEVEALFSADDGASVLHLNFIEVSEQFSFRDGVPFENALRAIYAEFGISVVIDEVVQMSGTPFAELSDFEEPTISPTSSSAQMARRGQTLVSSNALNVYVVESLPFVGGWSFGIPGPHDPSSPYFGVVVERGEGAGAANIVAHEVAHFLGLHHVFTVGVSGDVYDDPISDTARNAPNLMQETSTTLTAGQRFVVARSPLLKSQ